MASRVVRIAGANRKAPAKNGSPLQAGLDTLDFGFAIFDRNLKLVASQQGVRDAARLPERAVPARHRHHRALSLQRRARRLRPGRRRSPGHVARSSACASGSRTSSNTSWPSGRILNIRYAPIVQGGLVLSYADITERKRAERDVERKEAELLVALDNMPGALAYTDDELNIVFCNDRFAEMYPVPREFFTPGRPYPDFLRHLAEQRLLRRRRPGRAGRPTRRRACATPRASRSRTARPTAASTRSTAGAPRTAAR